MSALPRTIHDIANVCVPYPRPPAVIWPKATKIVRSKLAHEKVEEEGWANARSHRRRRWSRGRRRGGRQHGWRRMSRRREGWMRRSARRQAAGCRRIAQINTCAARKGPHVVIIHSMPRPEGRVSCKVPADALAYGGSGETVHECVLDVAPSARAQAVAQDDMRREQRLEAIPRLDGRRWHHRRTRGRRRMGRRWRRRPRGVSGRGWRHGWRGQARRRQGRRWREAARRSWREGRGWEAR